VTLAQPELQRDVPLAPFTTFGIGGPADLLATPRTPDELADAVRWARAEGIPWFLLGMGANILIGDKGFRGLVIKNEADGFGFDGTRLRAGSGAVVLDLIEHATEHGLSGLEHYQDIPSTVGGAMWQNLHFLSWPHERTHFIEEVTESATVLREDGQTETVDGAWFEFGYDDSRLHRTGEIVLDVTFALEPRESKEIQYVRDMNARWRAEKHPPGAVRMSAGSIFQKLEGVGAGRLIDAAGLKGARIGGAEVSDHHANYILNVDHASAADVRALIDHVQAPVEEHSGHRLEPEIGLIGEFRPRACVPSGKCGRSGPKP
jgi:UDP-N-acetylmuramate dehydrogenase